MNNPYLPAQPQLQVQQNDTNKKSVSQKAQYIFDKFMEHVAVKQLFDVAPVGKDGQRRLDAGGARIALSKYRNVPHGQISPNDRGIAHLVGKTMDELRLLLIKCPPLIYADIEASIALPIPRVCLLMTLIS